MCKTWLPVKQQGTVWPTCERRLINQRQIYISLYLVYQFRPNFPTDNVSSVQGVRATWRALVVTSTPNLEKLLFPLAGRSVVQSFFLFSENRDAAEPLPTLPPTTISTKLAALQVQLRPAGRSERSWGTIH